MLPHNSCEFCYSSCESQSEHPPPNISLPLKCLARYLKLDRTRSVGETGLDNALNEKNGDPKFWNIGLQMLCEDCEALLNAFGSEYQELQRIELRLSWTLEKLASRLESVDKMSEQDSPNVAEKEKLTIGHLRAKVIAKWRQTLSNSSPKLRLKRSSYLQDHRVPLKRQRIDEGLSDSEIDVAISEDLGQGNDVDLETISGASSSVTENEVAHPIKAEVITGGSEEVGEDSPENVTIGECKFDINGAEKIQSKEETIGKNRPRRSLRDVHRCLKCGKGFSSSHQLVEHHEQIHGGSDDEDLSDDDNSSGSEDEVLNEDNSSRDDDSDKDSDSSSDDSDYLDESISSVEEDVKGVPQPTSHEVAKSIKGDVDKELSSEAEAFLRYVTKKSKGTLTCPVAGCAASFVLKVEAELHSKMHGDWSCYFSGCKFQTNFVSYLALHELTHQPSSSKKNQLWKCIRCDYTAKDKASVMAHLTKSHLGIQFPQIECPICGAPVKQKFFEAPRSVRSCLSAHFRLMHDVSKLKPEDIQNCGKCPAYFSTKQKLRRHLNARHFEYNTRIHECSVCRRKFTQLDSLRHHKLSIHKMDPEKDFELECPNVACQARFHTEKERDLHVVFTHAKNLKEDTSQLCSHCGKRFPGVRHLAHHIRRVHNVKDKPKDPEKLRFVCEQCGKRFKSRNHLEVHELAHSGPASWKFSCDECGKKCMTTQKLEEHQRTHTKEKPFVCEVCGEKYAHRHNWRAHVISKHPEMKHVAAARKKK